MSAEPLVIEMGFTDIDNLIQDYAKALELDKESRKYNRDFTTIIRTNRTIFCFLITLVLFAYYQPQYIPGLSGEALSEAQFALQDALRAKKMDYSTVAANVAEYTAYVTKTRFSFANGMTYTAEELIHLLQENDYIGPIVTSLVNTYNVVFASGVRLSNVASSIAGLATDISQGNINFDRLGNYIGNGLWAFMVYVGFQLGVTIKNIATKVASMATSTRNDLRRIEGFPEPTGPRDKLITIRINSVTQVVTLNDVLNVINNPTQKIMPSIFDVFIAKLFDASGLWGFDEISDDESLAESVQSFETAKTYVTTIMDEKLDEISSSGYGSVDELTAIMKSFNIATETSIVIVMAAYNNIYKKLLNSYCVYGTTGRDISSQSSSQRSSQSQTLSQLTDYSYQTSCSRLSVVEIETKAEEALTKPVEVGRTQYQLRKKGDNMVLQKTGKRRSGSSDEEMSGGKNRSRSRSHNKSKKRKTKRRNSRRKTKKSRRKSRKM